MTRLLTCLRPAGAQETRVAWRGHFSHCKGSGRGGPIRSLAVPVCFFPPQKVAAANSERSVNPEDPGKGLGAPAGAVQGVGPHGPEDGARSRIRPDTPAPGSHLLAPRTTTNGMPTSCRSCPSPLVPRLQPPKSLGQSLPRSRPLWDADGRHPALPLQPASRSLPEPAGAGGAGTPAFSFLRAPGPGVTERKNDA